MTLNLQLPQKPSLKPSLSVFGVGGAGGNAVNNMISSGLDGVNFVVANTDSQAIEETLCENAIQLGESITQGLGAGSYPEVGKASAEEAVEIIQDHLQGSNMVFITAGMGGGTGTGASPVVARLAREQGILTVAVVTKPFHFEGTHRMRVAELGLQELQQYVDTLIVIPNQNLFRIADKNTTFLDAFKLADDVLHSGVRGITDLMVMPGLINLDFSDVRSVMGEMGKAMMGTGEAEGDKRAVEAAEAAIANPLLDNVSMQGARGVLINITGGTDMTLFEVDEAANRIREEVDSEANIIFGSAFDQNMNGKIRVSVVATGIDAPSEDHLVKHLYTTTTEAPKEIAEKIQKEQHNLTEKVTSSSTESDLHNTDNSTLTTDSFIPPAPIEPKSFTIDSPNISDNMNISEKSSHTKNEITEKDRPPRLFGGFFGKNGLSEPHPENNKAISEDFNKETPLHQITPNIESELDIPAFLRRKST